LAGGSAGDLIVRLATCRTAAGPRVVGIITQAGVDRFVELGEGVHAGSLAARLAEPQGLQRMRDELARGAAAGRFVEGTLLAPIPCPGKVICIGLNYRDHARESNAPIPGEPIVFSKFSSAVIGPGEPIVLPRVSGKVDYEAELVAVIGRRGKNIPVAEAASYVVGYMNGNDVSARDWQLEKAGKQWLLGKTPDSFAPIGPWLVTADEVADPRKLAVRLRLNGETMQDSTTAELIFGVDELVAHVSQLVTLEAGDLLFTGTPPGVGMARKPPVFLKAGDVVEVEIAGLGTLRNPVRDE
jgi:2-keto-4-pentenoate hydratase/2-oxohepta-3-ene-1,7-dioic acid hydratase in catechol pathway